MFRKKKPQGPKPEIGDYRIVEVTLNNGTVRYETQNLAYAPEGTFRDTMWLTSGSDATFAEARARARHLWELREAKREVVWP